MVGGPVRFLNMLLALVLACAGVHAAQADDTPLVPSCLANAPLDLPVDDLLDSKIAWHCSDSAETLQLLPVETEAERVLARFSSISDPSLPQFFVTRLGGFSQMTLAIRVAGGDWVTRGYATRDVEGMPTRPAIIAALPQATAPAGEVVVIFDRPSHAPLVLNAELHQSDPSQSPDVQYGLIIIAILLGMVLLPIVFDITFFRVLRQAFLPWHMAMAASFGLLLSVRSGIINVLAPVSIETWRVLLIMGLTAAIVSSLMFMRAFIEPGKLSAWALKAIPWVAVFSVVTTGIHAMSIPALRPVSTTLHLFGVMVPYLMLTFVILQSVWRRSRAGLYVFIGWLPIMVSTWGGITTHLLPFLRPDDMLMAFYIGMVSEMVATAMGVGDRFMTLKRERDVARAEASELDELSNSDPLTGLFNRRAIDARFDELRDEGYDSFALVDLDHFKRVNDTHGHDKGDDVLRAVAGALDQCEDCEAFRLGGEEFLLLLRGDDSERRVDAMRQSLPVRIARLVDGLEHMVTASVGLVVVPKGALPNAGFEDIYRYADRMLYEAKETGRNRMVSERLRAFRRRGPERRSSAAAA